MPRSFATRLDQFPPRRATCPTCAAWTHRVVNAEPDDSPYEAERRRNEPPGPRDWPATCPDCEREIPTISIIHIDGNLWRGRQE